MGSRGWWILGVPCSSILAAWQITDQWETLSEKGKSIKGIKGRCVWEMTPEAVLWLPLIHEICVYLHTHAQMCAHEHKKLKHQIFNSWSSLEKIFSCWLHLHAPNMFTQRTSTSRSELLPETRSCSFLESIYEELYTFPNFLLSSSLWVPENQHQTKDREDKNTDFLLVAANRTCWVAE